MHFTAFLLGNRSVVRRLVICRGLFATQLQEVDTASLGHAHSQWRQHEVRILQGIRFSNFEMAAGHMYSSRAASRKTRLCSKLSPGLSLSAATGNPERYSVLLWSLPPPVGNADIKTDKVSSNNGCYTDDRNERLTNRTHHCQSERRQSQSCCHHALLLCWGFLS